MNKDILVIATGNLHKLEEIKKILADFPYDIKSMKDVGLEGLEIIEDGSSFEENALIKAKAIMKKTGFMAMGDDSGLEVEALDNQPGIYSARFAGEPGNDKKNNQKLLKLMEEIPLEARRGRFVCAMAVAFPNGDEMVLRGECQGILGYEERGNNGFGYDPLFIVPQYNQTFAELDSDIKNKISHRARALEKLKMALTPSLRR